MERIIVNGIEKETDGYTLNYDAIVLLANKEAKHKPTVTYKTPDQAGTMSPGDWVFPEEGMIFNVANTGGA